LVAPESLNVNEPLGSVTWINVVQFVVARFVEYWIRYEVPSSPVIVRNGKPPMICKPSVGWLSGMTERTAEALWTAPSGF
jgi:hypothetical protein